MRNLALIGLALVGCSAVRPGDVTLSELDARSVLMPERFAVLSSERELGALPSAVPLGTKTSGRMVLFLEFEPPAERRELLRANLLLSAVQGSAAGVEVEVSGAGEAGARLVRWSDQPRALYPKLSRRVARRLGPDRLDVTEILQARREPREPLRLLLQAEPSDGEGVLIATGAAGGEPPRLELYFR